MKALLFGTVLILAAGQSTNKEYLQEKYLAAAKRERELTREWTIDEGTEREKKFVGKFVDLKVVSRNCNCDDRVVMSKKGKEHSEIVEVQFFRLSEDDQVIVDRTLRWRRERAERMKERGGATETGKKGRR